MALSNMTISCCNTQHNTEKGTCMLIDVEITGDRNVIKEEVEEILKYKDLTTEIYSACGM